MNRLFGLIVVFVIGSVASATVISIEPIPEGQPGSASNPLAPSDEVVIPVYTDYTLVGVDVILELQGPATIVGALDKPTAAAYGWDPGFTYDPVIPGTAVEISGGGNFAGNPGPVVGWYLIRCDDYGDVTATLQEGHYYGVCMDIDMERPDVVGQITIHQVPPVPTVTLVPIEEGQPGSPSNPVRPSEEITVWVTSDGVLVGLAARLDVTSGPATIVDAIKLSDCVAYGWDPAFSFDPLGVPGTSVEIGLGSFAGAGPGVVGYFTLRCDAEGVVVVDLWPTGYWPPYPPYDVSGRLEIYVAETFYVSTADGNDLNNGLTPETAFATIQKGIDTARDGDTVLVYPGVYTEALDFLGKAVTVQSIDEPAVLRAPLNYAVSFHHGEDANSILKNFIIKHCHIGLVFLGASPTVSNVTVVDNAGGAIADSGAYPNINNSIFWDNWGADLDNCEARYSCYRESDGSDGSTDADPCFADPCTGDYHLKSEGGRWDANSETWVGDDVTSPCIDAGDPNSEVGGEPLPNGGRMNMGAYGGRGQASKSLNCRHGTVCVGQAFGDATCDGSVDLGDVFALKSAWGKCAPWTASQCCADFNHDECISLADLFILKAGFGTSGYSPSTGNQNCPP
jgi:hypothetical protein